MNLLLLYFISIKKLTLKVLFIGAHFYKVNTINSVNQRFPVNGQYLAELSSKLILSGKTMFVLDM